jgi:Flp pilus assembly protein TadG
MLKSKRQQTRLGRRGVTTVEFAICCPILFLFTFASLEFSRVNMMRQTVENAVYEGCRRGIVPGATAEDVVAATQSVLNTVSTNGAQISVEPTVITEDTSEVTVSVDVPINSNCWVAPFFFADKHVASTLMMRRERGLNSNVE